ncbi:antitoxin VbhA family protein [Corynebacterium auriscanis]|uniref:antitoxin VbhA family protein n=1 Tax=Corynebacterium auriscanis TaxID=99807 RepID=UPI0024AD1529|nr:antitoxin VbhA family protein [Corynebacterium auriscanis]
MNIDHRTEDQKAATVRASMTMAGYTITPQDEEDIRLILRGEITGDEAVLKAMEADGYGTSARAEFLRRRIAEANNSAR